MRTNFVNQQARVVGNEGRPTDITFTAPLILHGDPVEGKDAATKNYVDYVFTHLNASNIKIGSLPASRLPSFSGDVSNVAGSNIFTLNPTGVPSGTYKKVTVDSKGRVVGYGDLLASDIPSLSWTKIYKNKPSTLVGYGINDGINIAGDTLSGYLKSTATPTQDMHAVTRGYVEAAAAAAGSVIEPGFIIPYATSVTPDGYLRCNGGEVSKVTYPALYAALGSPIVSSTALGNGAPHQYQYDFNFTQTGDLTNPRSETSLPGNHTAGGAILTKNRVYYIGGASAINTAVSTVRTAVVNADGTIGAWSTGTAIPGAYVAFSTIITKNRVYIIGGGNNTATAITNTYTAPINADGTLGTWASGPSLPAARSYGIAIITKNRVYFFGGATASNVAQSTVYTATINTDGTLSAWTTGTALPVATQGGDAFIIRDKIYLQHANSTSLYTATINADGTIGTWTLYPQPLPAAGSSSKFITTRNRVFFYVGSNTTTLIYTAPINADGTLGSWVQSGIQLVTGQGFARPIVTSSRIYFIGGNTPGVQYASIVQSVAFSGGLNDYTDFISGSYTPVSSPDNFWLPDHMSKETFTEKFYIKY